MFSEFSFPVLSAIIWVPIIAGVVILFIKNEQRDLIRGISITAAVALLALSGLVYFTYNNQVAPIMEGQEALMSADGALKGTEMFANGLAFEEKFTWVESLGISYHLGVDGLSVPMVLLTGMVAVAGVLISWRIDRIREFMAFFMLLVAGVYGVFVAVDMFLLFFFYELAIFPMYLLIAGWGWVKLREYAAMKLTLYILIGSVVALVGVIAMVITASAFFQTPEGAELLAQAGQAGIVAEDAPTFSFDMVQLTLAAEAGAFDAGGYFGIDMLTFAKFWFPLIFIGFGVLAGVFPFHNWSPDGHVAAPTAVSMIHAGVLMKVGAYAALRAGVQLMPEGAEVHLPWIVFLTVVNVVLGAFIAFRQRDFKYVIGFSSVSHMGLVSMGFATMNITGLTGAGLQMFSHGAMTALFFGCVGMVYDRAHTRDIPSLGGFIRKMPWVGFAFVLGGLTSMGMPGLSGFIAEYPIFMGMFGAADVTLNIGGFELSNYFPVLAVISVIGIVVTAAYVLRVTGQVFFGEFNAKKYPEVGDIFVTDRIILLLLGIPLIVIGIYPAIMSPMIEAGMRPVVALLGGGF
ncbi:MAG TPA: NADH-quinone oxidoreductase subunit M [Aggregatilineales bacterium]|nr:NADH-quinone oxidoreductase subunit M [Aggregatilineales bacterium]